MSARQTHEEVDKRGKGENNGFFFFFSNKPTGSNGFLIVLVERNVYIRSTFTQVAQVQMILSHLRHDLKFNFQQLLKEPLERFSSQQSHFGFHHKRVRQTHFSDRQKASNPFLNGVILQ